MGEWKTIDTVPWNKRVLLWWTPVTPNKHAECAIIGTVSSSNPGTYWDGIYPGVDYQAGYKPLERITHWTELPPPPKD